MVKCSLMQGQRIADVKEEDEWDDNHTSKYDIRRHRQHLPMGDMTDDGGSLMVGV